MLAYILFVISCGGEIPWKHIVGISNSDIMKERDTLILEILKETQIENNLKITLKHKVIIRYITRSN